MRNDFWGVSQIMTRLMDGQHYRQEETGVFVCAVGAGSEDMCPVHPHSESLTWLLIRLQTSMSVIKSSDKLLTSMNFLC